MYTIFTIILLALIMSSLSGEGIEIFINYCDIPTLCLLIVLCIPILISTGLIKDFFNSFKLSYRNKDKEEIKINEINRAIESLDLVMKTLLYNSGFISCFSAIIILRRLTDITLLGPNLSIAFLSIIYAFVINLILLPIRSKLKIKLNNFLD